MTTTVTQARISIQKFFDLGWADKTPIAWDNRKFIIEPDSPWVRLSVLHDGSPQGGQQTIGTTNIYRRTGHVIVQIFVPKETGTDLADGYVQDVLNIFDGKNTTPEEVIFRSGRSREIGPDGVWSGRIILFDFQYDEIK